MEINKDNRVKDKCLYSIEADDIRFSCYYSTIVKQRKISKGEYEYYQEKIKLNEEMGGLFVPSLRNCRRTLDVKAQINRPLDMLVSV